MSDSITAAEAAGFLAFMGEIAREAGSIHQRHFRRLDGYEKKGAIDLVTASDHEADAHLRRRISERFADHKILSEEADPPQDARGGWLWIVDPLDGTTNFAHGIPVFSVSIAVEYNHRTVAGVVYAPGLGELYAASRGGGATRNGERIRVSGVGRLDEALLATGFPYSFGGTRLEWLKETHAEFLGKTQGVLRMGSAAIDLALVAGGNLEFFYEPFLKPWDVAAGALLVEEAGGRTSDFAGAPFDPWGRQVAASNGQLHDEMLAIVAGRELADPAETGGEA